MIEPIIYTEIEQKNVIEYRSFVALSPLDSLIHSLDVLDFLAALIGKHEVQESSPDQAFEWIILNYKK